jgi:predicted regulator of Ras-like GTPase activity (Roadblock/LC7/MglB family)
MLDETLRKILETVEGARAVWLVGFDGIPVAGSAEAGFGRPDDLAAAYADLFRKVRAAADDIGRPDPKEVVVGDEDGAVVVRAVTAEYALVGVLGASGSLGRLRFEFRRASASVAAEVES